MPDNSFKPETVQIVSDLGQLKAFSDPAQARLLRILQKQGATIAQLAEYTGEPIASVHDHIDGLTRSGLVRRVPSSGEDNDTDAYRAGAKFYHFKPDPTDLEMVSGPVTTALLGAVSQELTASMATWPAQRMIGQLRRARLSPVRMLEFEERFELFLDEFFGSPEHPAEEREGDPVMSLASVVYRYPDEDQDQNSGE